MVTRATQSGYLQFQSVNFFLQLHSSFALQAKVFRVIWCG